MILNLSVVNVPKKSAVTNLKVNLTTEILERMTAHIKFFHLNVQGDKQYRKEFMRTSFDLEKLFSGGITSFIGMTFFGGLSEAADFPLKFPLVRVSFKSMQVLISKNSEKLFKGVYRLRNYTITDQYLKFVANKDFIIDYRFTGNKKKGSKAMVFYAHIESFVSFLPD